VVITGADLAALHVALAEEPRPARPSISPGYAERIIAARAAMERR
jgi:hypothetical protein